MKPNCYKPSIKKGKYCEEHRTNRRKETISIPLPPPSPIFESQPLPNNNLELYEERKRIIDEQEREYRENELIDKLKFEEIENKKYEKQIKDFEIDSLRNKVFNNELTENSFQIKFSMSNGTKVLHYFNNNALFEDLFEYLDVYFYDNNINITNYELVYFPNHIFSKKDHSNIRINEKFTTKNIVLLIKNLDA
jgi:hypothetical protein